MRLDGLSERAELGSAVLHRLLIILSPLQGSGGTA